MIRTVPISQGPKSIKYQENGKSENVIGPPGIPASLFPCLDDRCVHLDRPSGSVDLASSSSNSKGQPAAAAAATGVI